MNQTINRNYLLTILSIVLAFSSVDRAALGLFLQDIKIDLGLSDTQLGLLTGIAFALFYSVMGIPIARWADRGNRVFIISITTAVWSAAVVLCGAAGNFIQLLLIRVCVAVGEAGCIPPAHSLIADCFSRAERARASARYLLGGPLSVLIGYFIAGWLNKFWGWRWTFFLLGLPGLGVAALAWYTLKEPRRERQLYATISDGERDASRDAAGPGRPSAWEVCRTLCSNSTFRHLLLCFSVMSFFAYGIGQWQAAFFVRSYGLDTGTLGTWFTVIYGLCGLLGTYWGGELASRFAANDERFQLRVMAVVYVGFGVVSALIYVSTSQYVAFGLMGLVTLVGMGTYGPLFATIQTLVPGRMRAMSIAVLYLFANLIGMGLGPLAAGILSDAFQPVFGSESLRYSLLAFCPGYLWGGVHLWLASRTVTRDLEAARLGGGDLRHGAEAAA